MSIKIDEETQKAVHPESIRTLTLPNIIGALVATFAFVVTWKILL